MICPACEFRIYGHHASRFCHCCDTLLIDIPDDDSLASEYQWLDEIGAKRPIERYPRGNDI